MRYSGHKIFLNGKLTDISTDVEVFMAEKNIYEVIRIIDGKILFWKDHLKRLENSLKAQNVDIKLSEYDFPGMIAILIGQNMLWDMNIRIDVFVSDSINIIVGFIPSFYPDAGMYQNGVKTVTLKSERDNPSVKVVQHELKFRVDHILENKDIFEVLLVNEQGNFTEGSRTNLFFIKGEEVFTPKSTDVLLGVTRDKVIEICQNENIILKECDINYLDLTEYDSCFLTGTSPRVLPVNYVDNTSFIIQNGILLKIRNAYNFMINRSLYDL